MILGIVGGVVLALMVCLFAMRGKLKSAISRRRVTRAQNEGRICSFRFCFPQPNYAQNAVRFLFTFFLLYTETHDNDPESPLVKQEQIFFTLDALIKATDNFDEKKKLGEGGFGSVYKVLLF